MSKFSSKFSIWSFNDDFGSSSLLVQSTSNEKSDKYTKHTHIMRERPTHHNSSKWDLNPNLSDPRLQLWFIYDL